MSLNNGDLSKGTQKDKDVLPTNNKVLKIIDFETKKVLFEGSIKDYANLIKRTTKLINGTLKRFHGRFENYEQNPSQKKPNRQKITHDLFNDGKPFVIIERDYLNNKGKKIGSMKVER